jgi:DNA-binding NarL/FixJ family response regulator
VRIVLADDHSLVRAGLHALLEGLGEAVVGEAGDGEEALKLIAELRPDAVFLDITMPGLNGFDVATRATQLSPNTRIVILSMHADPAYVAQALRAGVAGYLLKGASVGELRVALDAIAKGDTFLSPAISRQVVDGFLSGSEVEDPLAGLTPRQREILKLIAEGRSTKEIAANLQVSVKTVETHRAQLMARLSIRDVAGLVRFAIRSGLITAD